MKDADKMDMNRQQAFIKITSDKTDRAIHAFLTNHICETPSL
jgi:hypothetical protein